MKKQGDKIYLTVGEAIRVLPDKNLIHTFYNAPFGLIGADWDRKEIIDKLNLSDIIEVTGEQAQAMNHGICAYNKDTKLHSDILFIETDPEKIKPYACGTADKETYKRVVEFALQSMLELSKVDKAYNLQADIEHYYNNAIAKEGILSRAEFVEMCKSVMEGNDEKRS